MNGRLVPSVYIYITMLLRNSIRIVAVREWANGHCGGHGKNAKELSGIKAWL